MTGHVVKFVTVVTGGEITVYGCGVTEDRKYVRGRDHREHCLLIHVPNQRAEHEVAQCLLYTRFNTPQGWPYPSGDMLMIKLSWYSTAALGKTPWQHVGHGGVVMPMAQWEGNYVYAPRPS